MFNGACELSQPMGKTEFSSTAKNGTNSVLFTYLCPIYGTLGITCSVVVVVVFVVVVVVLFYVHGKVMSERSVNLTTLFLGRLRPPKRLLM